MASLHCSKKVNKKTSKLVPYGYDGSLLLVGVSRGLSKQLHVQRALSHHVLHCMRKMHTHMEHSDQGDNHEAIALLVSDLMQLWSKQLQ